eukprot:1194619-Prorocentrum_minimum.AAC.6
MRLNAADPEDPRRYNPQLVPEFGAFVPDEGNPYAPPGSRQTLMTRHDGRLQYVSEIHPAYDTLHYPLLHPRGEAGWRPGILHDGAPNDADEDADADEDDNQPAPCRRRGKVSAMQFAAYHLQTRGRLDAGAAPSAGLLSPPDVRVPDPGVHRGLLRQGGDRAPELAPTKPKDLARGLVPRYPGELAFRVWRLDAHSGEQWYTL